MQESDSPTPLTPCFPNPNNAVVVRNQDFWQHFDEHNFLIERFSNCYDVANPRLEQKQQKDIMHICIF